jgi:glutamate synthase (ferredoxin)
MKPAGAAVTAFLLLASQSSGFTSLTTTTKASSHRSRLVTGHEGIDRRDVALSAFHLPPGVQSNMFEGPAPLVRERDACGVGFIANTQEGGE